MLLETHTDHPRYVAYSVTPCGHYAVKTVLLISGHSFETTVWEQAEFDTRVKVNMTSREASIRFHQLMVDKYTFMQWTG